MNKKFDKFFGDVAIYAIIYGSDRITEEDRKRAEKIPPVEKVCGFILLYIFIGLSVITNAFYKIRDRIEKNHGSK